MDPVFPRLHVITGARRPVEVVTAAVAASVRLGVPDQLAIQVRVEDDITDRSLYDLSAAILAICHPQGVLCLVNDRLHIALAVGADGGHVGADDLPVAAARKIMGGVLGATCRDPGSARAAVADGATYLGVGPAYLTVTKPGLPAPLGPGAVGAVAAAVPRTPVIAIGGVTAGNAGELIRAGASGIAVVGAVSEAADPGEATERLLKALS
ncbi:thiamine phosphate synthase [Winogradskya consettensis]|uniref:Thiamine-phosphate synthase n=1 Tax=Winogradskya consettensis TaxID=113560 RepID=A0A919VIX1_9ACTN|nr:thiamine phosphate synthase [Actinoplanes consettensis]GIM67589.1 thiamine-phosphate synthase [Actinoplanes consettensis]